MNLIYLILIGLFYFSPFYAYSQEEVNAVKETEVYLQVLSPAGSETPAKAKDILHKRLKMQLY